MRLCRSAPGSHPAPVPRCRGGTARWKGVRPCRVAISVLACASCSGQTAQSAFRKASGNRLGAGTGRRKRDKGSGQSFRLPGHDGQPPGTANSLDKSCAMVCHKSRKFLFFWAGACGRRRHPSWAKGGTGAFPHSGKNPMGWFGEREKKGRGEGRGRAVTVGRYGSVDRQGCRTGPWRKRLLSFLTYAGIPCRKREPQAVCASPTLHSVSACPGPTDHCMLATMGDRAVVCRKICPGKARWEGEGV